MTRLSRPTVSRVLPDSRRSVIRSGSRAATRVHISVLPLRRQPALKVLENEQLVLVLLAHREYQQPIASSQQLDFVQVGIWSPAATHVEAVVFFLDRHALRGEQTERRVVHVQRVVASAVVRNADRKARVGGDRSEEAVRPCVTCDYAAYLCRSGSTAGRSSLESRRESAPGLLRARRLRARCP